MAFPEQISRYPLIRTHGNKPSLLCKDLQPPPGSIPAHLKFPGSLRGTDRPAFLDRQLYEAASVHICPVETISRLRVHPPCPYGLLQLPAADYRKFPHLIRRKPQNRPSR